MAVPRVSAGTVRRLAVASVVANVAIVVTGGAVRLTSSGLGCPTWPRCTADSYTPTAEYAEHGTIEFGNRMLTFALGLVALATLIAVLRLRPRRRPLVVLGTVAFLGIPTQAVLGGITVLTGLNPWTVAGHFLVSAALVAVTATLAWRAWEAADGPRRPVVAPVVGLLARAVAGVAAVVLVLGTVVTGSGPHAGDEDAARTGFDPELVSRLHADAVLALVGLTIATLVALRATGAPGAVRRAAVGLLGVELAQGTIGYVQYFTDLPVLLVGAHLLGACLTWLATIWLLLATGTRRPAAPAAGGDRAGPTAAVEPEPSVPPGQPEPAGQPQPEPAGGYRAT